MRVACTRSHVIGRVTAFHPQVLDLLQRFPQRIHYLSGWAIKPICHRTDGVVGPPPAHDPSGEVHPTSTGKATVARPMAQLEVTFGPAFFLRRFFLASTA